ncbi:MAG: hypothetical protein WB626_02945 [Bacteroidota bacterium]
MRKPASRSWAPVLLLALLCGAQCAAGGVLKVISAGSLRASPVATARVVAELTPGMVLVGYTRTVHDPGGCWYFAATAEGTKGHVPCSLVEEMSAGEAAPSPAPASSGDRGGASGASVSLEGTTWSGKTSNGDLYEFTFLPGGRLRFRTNNSRSEMATFEDEGDIWARNGQLVVLTISDYSTYLGTIDGNRMRGKSWNVVGKRWTWDLERQGSAPRSSAGATGDVEGRGTTLRSSATVAGEWKEHWGTPGQTDVTYNDRYRVTLAGSTVDVRILEKDQRIFDERLEGNVLMFSQRTDAWVVRYELTLQPDGRWLSGTATTPEKIVPVKWERVR